MIQPEDVLVGLGEVGAAFAGFSGVVAALAARSGPDWPPPARFRFANLLVASVAATMFAFLPLTLALFVTSASTVWGSSSAALGLFSLYFLLDRLRVGRRVMRQAGGLRRWSAWFFTALVGSVVVLQLLNVVGRPFEREGAPYVAGVLALLLVSVYQFVLLALESVAGRGEPAVDEQ